MRLNHALVHCVPALCLLLVLGACNRGPTSPTPAAQPRPQMPTTAAEVVPNSDPRMLRFHRVDMLIAQWDVAQAGGRASQAQQLGQQIRAEVDGAFPDFVAASRGRYAVNLQYAAVSALGFSARSEATQVLLDRLADSDPQLVGNALIALKIRADPETPLAPLLKMVTAGAPAPRRYAPLAIANVVDARYRTGRGVDPEMQRAAAHVLSGVVADRDPFVRLHVAKALGALRSPGTYDLLMILMRDEEIRIRFAAAAGLERLGDARGFPEVVRLLSQAPEDMKPLVRDVLVSYAGKIEGRQFTPAEVQALDVSEHAWGRWYGDYANRHGMQPEVVRSPSRPAHPPVRPTQPGSQGTPQPLPPTGPGQPRQPPPPTWPSAR